jgi:hypothetical protein
MLCLARSGPPTPAEIITPACYSTLAQRKEDSGKALQPQTQPRTWCGRSSNIRPHERRISRGQVWPRDPNRFAINGLGLCTASAHSETAGIAVPFGSDGDILDRNR